MTDIYITTYEKFWEHTKMSLLTEKGTIDPSPTKRSIVCFVKKVTPGKLMILILILILIQL